MLLCCPFLADGLPFRTANLGGMENWLDQRGVEGTIFFNREVIFTMAFSPNTLLIAAPVLKPKRASDSAVARRLAIVKATRFA